MKKVIFLLAALFVLTGYAEVRTKDDMINEIDTQFADNSVGGITPAKLRSVVTDIFETAKWRSFTTLNSNTTLDQGIHNGIIADDSAGSLIFTLPDNASNSGAIFGILKSSDTANIITINPAGSDTVNGESTVVLDIFGESISLISDGNGSWWITTTNIPIFNTIQFNTENPSLPDYKAGQMAYDPNCLTVTADTGVDGVRVQIGQELQYLVYNNTGVTIDDGKPVYASGVNSGVGLLEIGLANASSFFTSAQTLGLATSDIPTGTVGLVTNFGQVRDFDTSALNEGGLVYLDIIAGGLTNTSPTYPNEAIIIGSCIKSHATEGVIELSVSSITRILGTKSYSFTSSGIGAGTYYIGGYYDWSSTDANLDEGSTTETYGTANLAYNAHAGVVFGGQGAVDVGQVGLRCNGVTFNEATGVLNTSDTDIITEDITTVALNEYMETEKKFLGIVEYELYVVSGAPTTYSLDFNYGYSKYEDFGNRDFTLYGIEVTGLGNSNDTNFDIEVLHHKTTGWQYATTGFDAGNGKIADFSDDLAPYDDIANNANFAWKRTDLNTFIDGNGSEGILYRVTTGTNNTVQSMDMHISGFIESQ